jgi:hypothetical protein
MDGGEMPSKQGHRPRNGRTGGKLQGRDYSNKPAALKERLRAGNDILEDMQEDVELFYGKPISEWDFEELQYGTPRRANGSLTRNSKPPSWMTPVLMAEAQRRLKQMTRDQMGFYAGAAIKVMAELMQKSRVDMVRYNAARYILDQIIGMPTQRVEVEEGASAAEFMADFLIELDGRQHKVIEGEVKLNFNEDADDDDDYDDDEEEDEE